MKNSIPYENMNSEEREFYDELQNEIKRATSEEAYEKSKKSWKNDKTIKVEFEDSKEAYLYYKAKYEAIRDASFWRMTEPLRKLVDYYNWKRTGVKKEVFEDEISAKSGDAKHTEIGVHLHLYYEDLLDEFCEYFDNIPEKFDLFISCKKGADIAAIKERARKIRFVGKIVIKETQNRGRDIAPFYVLFGKALAEYDILLHVHSKKSLYTGGEKAEWRHEALDGVLKNEAMVRETLRLMRLGGTEAGLVFGEMTKMLPPMALHWLYNTGKGSELLQKMHVPFENHMFFYPVGSFFWVKTEAIKPIFDLKLTYQDFDEENGQIDGTLAHALERVIAFVTKHRGYDMYIYDADTDKFSKNVSYKCFQQYFTYNTQNLSDLLKREFEVITFDIFDTLITRLIYEPDDVFRLMARKIEYEYGKRVDYLSIRKKAESIAWKEQGDYCNIHHIYEKLPEVSDFTQRQADELKQMEIDLEYELCVPRRDVLNIFNSLIEAGKKVILISDMYLTTPIITKMLEKCGYKGYEDLWVSCEKGKRKDRDTIWDDFLAIYGDKKTIHIGDNPHSDCQIIGDRRRQYLLLLSPIEQFRFSKQYEKYRNFVDTSVENAVMLGYMVNECEYNSPFALRDNGLPRLKDIRSVSQGVFAPVMLKYVDYLHKTSKSDSRLLFLAREGYFLEQLYKKYCESFGKEELEHVYFLTSRRATCVPQISHCSDIMDLLNTKYNGKLSTLLNERFGLENIRVDKDEKISLPKDHAKVMSILADYTKEILKEAKCEKKLYLEYIDQELGENIDWEKIVLVDVGYSGTIQYYLMKILGTSLEGCYMACGYNMKPDLLNGTYRSPYAFWRDKSFITGQLFLEAVMAAPHGQVVKFNKNHDKVEAILKPEKKLYGEKAALFQKEIYSYVEFMGKILVDISPLINGKLAECMFSDILKSNFLDSNLKNAFCVGDGYCSDGDWVFNENTNKWELRH